MNRVLDKINILTGGINEAQIRKNLITEIAVTPVILVYEKGI